MALAQEHQAYPVLHYFHAPDRSTALAPAIAVLDDALVLLDHGAAPEHRLDRVTMGTSVSAVNVLLAALKAAHIDSAEHAPPIPPLDVLHRQGIPAVAPGEYERTTADLSDRRALLLAFVASDGWSWHA